MGQIFLELFQLKTRVTFLGHPVDSGRSKMAMKFAQNRTLRATTVQSYIQIGE